MSFIHWAELETLEARHESRRPAGNAADRLPGSRAPWTPAGTAPRCWLISDPPSPVLRCGSDEALHFKVGVCVCVCGRNGKHLRPLRRGDVLCENNEETRIEGRKDGGIEGVKKRLTCFVCETILTKRLSSVNKCLGSMEEAGEEEADGRAPGGKDWRDARRGEGEMKEGGNKDGGRTE